MKRTLLTILAVLLLFPCFATRRALVIGIGEYPATSGWHKINGDKDIPLVEKMLCANGFEKQNIVKLKNQQATYLAICCELDRLITKSQKGDIVYIHFSGHGQQITDLNGDEPDGRDEAWIPYDAKFKFEKGKYEGQCHLVDDQLYGYLHRLRQAVGATGKIIVVADACHSGDGSRSDDDEDKDAIRGTDMMFIIDNIQQTVDYLTSFIDKAKATFFNRNHISPPQQKSLEWTYISACNANQCNKEFNGHGSLTEALIQEMNSLKSLSVTALRDRLIQFYKKNINNIRHMQTPGIDCPKGGEKEIVLDK